VVGGVEPGHLLVGEDVVPRAQGEVVGRRAAEGVRSVGSTCARPSLRSYPSARSSTGQVRSGERTAPPAARVRRKATSA
jgi:hypothetical protein